MTLILDMATGAEFPLEAPGYQNAGAVKAHSADSGEYRHTELQLVVIEATSVDRRSCLDSGIDIAELIRIQED